MSEPAAPDEHPEDPFAACTAVLMTVRHEIATRLEAFLLANGVACRIRTSTVTPEQLAQEALRSASPTVATLPDSPVGRLFKGKRQRDLKAEIELHASGFAQHDDVLVRPQDLPPGVASSEPQTTNAPPPPDPWRRPDDDPAMDADPAAPGVADPTSTGVGAASPIQLCQLPWDQAWALVGRLAESGIAAAVLESEASSRDVPMAQRVVPVGVQSEDIERARSFL